MRLLVAHSPSPLRTRFTFTFWASTNIASRITRLARLTLTIRTRAIAVVSRRGFLLRGQFLFSCAVDANAVAANAVVAALFVAFFFL